MSKDSRQTSAHLSPSTTPAETNGVHRRRFHHVGFLCHTSEAPTPSLRHSTITTPSSDQGLLLRAGNVERHHYSVTTHCMCIDATCLQATTSRLIVSFASSMSMVKASLDETSALATCDKEFFMAKFSEHVGLYLKTSYSETTASLWLSLRLQAGLALSYAAPIVSLLSSFLTSFTETEKELISVERVLQYMDIPQEENCGFLSPRPDWPTHGQIEFEHVTLRYKPSVPAALNTVSFKINAGMQVGVVGRTGAGKSSIINALFRLAPICGGRILIDSLNVAEVSWAWRWTRGHPRAHDHARNGVGGVVQDTPDATDEWPAGHGMTTRCILPFLRHGLGCCLYLLLSSPDLGILSPLVRFVLARAVLPVHVQKRTENFIWPAPKLSYSRYSAAPPPPIILWCSAHIFLANLKLKSLLGLLHHSQASKLCSVGFLVALRDFSREERHRRLLTKKTGSVEEGDSASGPRTAVKARDRKSFLCTMWANFNINCDWRGDISYASDRCPKGGNDADTHIRVAADLGTDMVAHVSLVHTSPSMPLILCEESMPDFYLSTSSSSFVHSTTFISDIIVDDILQDDIGTCSVVPTPIEDILHTEEIIISSPVEEVQVVEATSVLAEPCDIINDIDDFPLDLPIGSDTGITPEDEILLSHSSNLFLDPNFVSYPVQGPTLELIQDVVGPIVLPDDGMDQLLKEMDIGISSSYYLPLPDVQRRMFRGEGSSSSRAADATVGTSVDDMLSFDGHEAVDRLLVVGSWQSLFSIEEYRYHELTLEFLTTFCILDRVDETTRESASVSFRMGGHTYTCGVGTLAVYAGIYTQDELIQSDVIYRLHEFPTGVPPSKFWQSITRRNLLYEARAAKSTQICSPALRYIQHLIGHSINGRAMNQNVAGWQDLLYLFSMHRRVPLHLGRVLAHYLLRQATYLPLKSIGGSHYITRIAKGSRSVCPR
ncbi:ABC transporter C family member 13 [Platanthera guangdongensis]|uniref:ABC transporter C family member 13 n=1 Tax=Platanthera guangdongensis TaxID=2320717 RepID=A0ABR2LV30_9ASPA